MKYLSLILFAFAVSGCEYYTQLYITKSLPPIKNQEDNFVFENDTVRITYDFWSEKGKLSFSIYNKLSVPIWIDWKQSSFFRNDIKENYWNDIEITNTQTSFTGASISGNYIYLPTGKRYSLSSNMGRAYSSSLKTKPERVTFIAPHSSLTRSQFILLANPIPFNSWGNMKYKDEPSTIDSTKMVRVYYVAYSKENTPLLFRNFITMSLSEKFEGTFLIDHSFFVSAINEMSQTIFQGKQRKDLTYEYPWTDTRYFYFNNLNDHTANAIPK